MTTLTYRELRSKETFLPLLDQAFRWPFNPRLFEDFINIDPRSKDGPVGFCAVENGRVLGFFGVLDLATRTLDGKVEYVGGIYGVATLPSHTRKGISTTLMTRANEHFEEKGYRFSFLTTSHTIVAHNFYTKLGYKDVTYFPSVYKVLMSQKAKASRKEKPSKVDLDRVLRIYNEYTKDKTGFVIRNNEHWRMLQKDQGLKPKNWIIGKQGYAIFKKDNGGVWIRELLATSADEMQGLLSKIEEKAKDVVYDRTVLDNTLLRIYEANGYMVENKSHSVLMAKPLTQDASMEQMYGNRFFMDSLDWF